MSRLVVITICALWVAMQAGCASVPRVLPDEFDLGHARIDAADVTPSHASTGTQGKASQAATLGAAGATGVGLTAGFAAALPCIFLGPYAPACFAAAGAAAATGAAVGGAVGVAYGVAAPDDPARPDLSAAEREMLDAALAKRTVRELLVDRLQGRVRESAGVDLPVADPQAQDPAARWRIVLDALDVAPQLNDSDGPYALLATASLAVREAGSGETAFQRRYRTLSQERRTTAEWSLDNAAAARAALDDLMSALAEQMHFSLSGEDLTRGGVLWASSHYRKGFFSRTTYAIVNTVDGIERRNEQPIHLLSGLHEVEVAYRRESYLCGYAGCVDFEKERRLLELRVEAGRSYMPFAIRDCDRDWLGIVATGKSAGDDLATWRIIGDWPFADLARDAAAHEVVAGELPPLTCESP